MHYINKMLSKNSMFSCVTFILFVILSFFKTPLDSILSLYKKISVFTYIFNILIYKYYIILICLVILIIINFLYKKTLVYKTKYYVSLKRNLNGINYGYSLFHLYNNIFNIFRLLFFNLFKIWFILNILSQNSLSYLYNPIKYLVISSSFLADANYILLIVCFYLNIIMSVIYIFLRLSFSKMPSSNINYFDVYNQYKIIKDKKIGNHTISLIKPIQISNITYDMYFVVKSNFNNNDSSPMHIMDCMDRNVMNYILLNINESNIITNFRNNIHIIKDTSRRRHHRYFIEWKAIIKDMCNIRRTKKRIRKNIIREYSNINKCFNTAEYKERKYVYSILFKSISFDASMNYFNNSY